MQNPHIKYLKTTGGQLLLFYFEHNGVFLRAHLESGWSSPQMIVENAASIFSLCQYGNICYIFYSSTDGQLALTTTSDFQHWEHRPMMQGVEHTGNTKFFMLPMEDAFHVIYHMPTETRGVDSLVYTAFRNGQWEKPYQIDRFLPAGANPFFARRLSREHIILYYKTGRNVWSAREMLVSPYTRGTLTTLFQTPAPCTDVSIVNDHERIHMLYIVRGRFRMQVVYQYKHTVTISTPRVIWEDVNCDNCIVFIENGQVVLMWVANGQTYRCASDNNGATFGAVEKYLNDYSTYSMKAELIGVNSDALNAAECYGDHTRGFIPGILPIAGKPFASASGFESNHGKQGNPEEFIPSPAAQTNHSQTNKSQTPQGNPMFHGGHGSQGNQRNQGNQGSPSQSQPQGQPSFTKQLATLKRDYDRQVEELSTLLAQRSEEVTSINAQWRAQTTRMETEIHSLHQENRRLQGQMSLQSHGQGSHSQSEQRGQEQSASLHSAERGTTPSSESETAPAQDGESPSQSEAGLRQKTSAQPNTES